MTKIEAYQQKREELKVLLRELLNMGHDAIQREEALESKLKKYEQEEIKKQAEEQKEEVFFHVGDEVEDREGHKLLILRVVDKETVIVYNGYYKTSYTHNCITDGWLEQTGTHWADIQNIFHDLEDDCVF